MSSPLDSIFFNELNRCAPRKLGLCTLRFAAIFHKQGNWKSKFKPKSKSNAIQLQSNERWKKVSKSPIVRSRNRSKSLSKCGRGSGEVHSYQIQIHQNSVVQKIL